MRRWVLAVLAAGAAALWSVPAAAAEPGACVQEKLAARGLYKGPADGVLGPLTTAASAAFTSSMTFPMPPLTTATAAEWCAVLTGWDRRDANPFPDKPGLGAAILPYRNSDTAALPIGIRFREDVPVAIRKLIVDDFAWLAKLGPLQQTDHLTRLFGLPVQISGPDLLAWYVHRVHAMGSGKICPRRELVLEPTSKTTWQMSDSFNLNCNDLPKGADAFVDIPTVGADPGTGRAVYVGDQVMLAATAHESAPMINVVTNGSKNLSFGANADDDIGERIYRLSVLAHEAFHTIATDDAHYACDDLDYIFDGKFDVGYFGYGRNSGSPAEDCDVGFKAYAAQTFVLEALAASCDCSARTRNTILQWATEIAAVSVVRLKEPWKVPDHADLRGTALAGKRFTDIPIQPFFDLSVQLAEGVAAAQQDCASNARCQKMIAQARAFSDLATAAFGQSPERLKQGWRLPPGDKTEIDTDWAMVWLARAQRAAGSDYNVPLRWVTPCRNSPMGCEKDWLGAITSIEPGVQSAKFKLTSVTDSRVLHIKLPQDWMNGRSTREVRLSVQEANGKPLTAALQCGAKNAVFITGRPNGGKQTFTSLDCYVGVLTLRDTTSAEFSVLVDLASRPALSPTPTVAALTPPVVTPPVVTPPVVTPRPPPVVPSVPTAGGRHPPTVHRQGG